MSFLYNYFSFFFFFLHHYFRFYKLLKLTSLQSCLHHNIFLWITDTCKINYTYYSFRWSCDIDIHLFLYGLHDTTLYYYWHHACSCTLYRMYFKIFFFSELTVFVVVKINSFQCQCWLSVSTVLEVNIVFYENGNGNSQFQRQDNNQDNVYLNDYSGPTCFIG